MNKLKRRRNVPNANQKFPPVMAVPTGAIPFQAPIIGKPPPTLSMVHPGQMTQPFIPGAPAGISVSPVPKAMYAVPSALPSMTGKSKTQPTVSHLQKPGAAVPGTWSCVRVDNMPNVLGHPNSGFSKSTCPNDLKENDFERIALLSGLDIPAIKQLWLEFHQLTQGKKFLDRDQYRNIFVNSLYSVAMQNLDTLAEETFRSFDRDKNGHLDFFDFISAYKANSPVLADGSQKKYGSFGL